MKSYSPATLAGALHEDVESAGGRKEVARVSNWITRGYLDERLACKQGRPITGQLICEVIALTGGHHVLAFFHSLQPVPEVEAQEFAGVECPAALAQESGVWSAQLIRDAAANGQIDQEVTLELTLKKKAGLSLLARRIKARLKGSLPLFHGGRGSR